MLALFDSVAYEALPYVFLGLGLALTYRYLRIVDLTFAASFAGAPAVLAALLVGGTTFAAAATASALFAAGAALLTLASMRYLRLDSLLASLLTSVAGFAVALLFTQGTLSLNGAWTPLTPLQAIDFQFLSDGLPLHPAEITVFAALALAAKVALDAFLRSELGLALRAMEDDASRETLLPSLGISRWRLTAIGLIGGNLLAALSGALVMMREGQVTASRGFDALVTVIAAYLLGAVLFERRQRGVPARNVALRALDSIGVFSATSAAILGIVGYFLLLALLLRMDLPTSTPKLVLVALVLSAFALTRWRGLTPAPALRRQSGSDKAIRIAEVVVEYPTDRGVHLVLDGVGLRVGLGEVVQLAGPNGSGKSSLLRALAGRIPAHGLMVFPHADTSEPLSNAVGYVSQDSSLSTSANLTVAENLALFGVGPRPKLFRRWRAPNATKLPAAVRELAVAKSQATAGMLSGGQRQALAISALLLRPDAPRLVLLDEPLAHLDETHAQACVGLVRELAAAGRAVVIVQHDLGPPDAAPSAARNELARRLDGRVDLAAPDAAPSETLG